MSYSIPAIISTDSFMHTRFKKEKEVLVFKNVDDLIKNIFNLKENKKLSNLLSINSRILLKQKYNMNKVLYKYNEII